MPPTLPTGVKGTVPKINNELAVGGDIAFQRRWWGFERAVWIFFTILVLLGVFGFFGRGLAARGHVRSKDGTIDVHYERIQRFSTPSMVDIQFGPNAVHDGKVQLWINEATVTGLGGQRIVPQPASSVIGDDGIYYTFPATGPPASVQLALQPSAPGFFHLEARVTGSEMLTMNVIVMP